MEQLNAVAKTPEPEMPELNRSLGREQQFGGVIWKYCVGLLVAVCMSFIIKAQPVITSFSPSSGPVGTTVTIAGSGFGTSAASNIVYFGPVKATISSATANSLTVTVPPGAAYAPITVTTASLTGQSKDYYTPTFTTCSSILNGTNPFGSAAAAPSSATGTRINSSDIDGDGVPDLVTFNNFSVNIFRNTTTGSGNDITFAAKYSLSLPAGTTSHQHYGAVVTDLDGDGKPDIALVNNINSRLLLYRNQSTSGNIAFSAATLITGFSGPIAVTAGDFNGDGKPDLAVLNSNTNAISLLKNKSTTGNLDFEVEASLASGSSPFHMLAADFNNDGKTDLAVSNNNASGTVTTFENTYSGGLISFNAGVAIAAGVSPQGMAAADLNNDGAVDLVVINTGSLSFLRNTSTSSISFSRTSFTPAGALPFAGRVAAGDFDGDNKPDLVIGSNASAIYCFKNTTVAGAASITFDATVVAVPTGVANGQPVGVCVGDFNNDERPDIADVNAGSANVDVFINKVSKVVVSSMSDTTGMQGSAITIIGTGLSCIDSVAIGGVKADFISADENTVKITAGAGATGNVVLFTNSRNKFVGPKFTFVVAPSNMTYIVSPTLRDTVKVTYGTESFTHNPYLNDGGGGITYTIENITGSVPIPPDIEININKNTGQIGWLHDLKVGTYRIRVRATNAAGSVDAYMTLIVVPGVPKDFEYFSSPYETVFGKADSTGNFINHDLYVDSAGQAVTFTLFKVTPAVTAGSIKVNPSIGTVYWDSTLKVGSYSIIVRAANATGFDTTTIILNVKPLAPDQLAYQTPNPRTIKYGVVGGVNVDTINWHGQTGTFTMTSGVPAHIAFSTTTGRISWDDSLPVGTYVMTVTATNTAGTTAAAATFTLTVEAEAPSNLVYASPVNADFSVAGATATPDVKWHGNTVTYSITNPSELPAGITIDPVTGIISWPNTLLVDTVNIRVIATNAIGSSTEDTIELRIRPLVPTGLTYNTVAPIPFGTAGTAAVATAPDWHGQTGVFSIANAASLPAGITINAATGTIQWTGPVKVGTYNLQVRATNSRGYQQVIVVLQIVADAPSGFGYTPASYTAFFGKVDSIPNAPAVNWHGDTGTYSIVSVLPLPVQGTIGVSATGKINWTANLSVLDNYVVTVRATNGKGNQTTTFSLSIKPKVPDVPVYNPGKGGNVVGAAGVSATPKTTWNGEQGVYEFSGTFPSDITTNTTTGVISWAATLAAGSYDIKVNARNSAGAGKDTTYNITILPLAPTGFSYQDNGDTATFSVAGSGRAPLVGTGGGTAVYTIETTGVSPEISINSATGVISRTGNLAIGNYTFTVKMSNGTGSLTTTYTLKVVAGNPRAFVYATPSATLPYGTAGNSVVPTVNWMGDQGKFSISGAPAGVTVDVNTGVIGWTNAVKVGTYNLTVTATNNQNPPATAPFLLKITGEAPTDLAYTPAFSNVDAGISGASAQPGIDWHGDTGTFSIVNAATIPADITVDEKGIIHWTDDLLVGTYNIQVRATNTTGNSNTVIYPLNVAPGKPTIVYDPGFLAILTGGTGTSVKPVIKWNSSTSAGSIEQANPYYPTGLVSLDPATGILSFNAASITAPVTYDILIAVANTESKQGFTTYKLIIGKVPSELKYNPNGYDMVEGTTLTSATPDVKWNGVQGVFKLYGAPAGVTIDETTGVITFGPTVAPSPDPVNGYTFTVKAESSLGSSNEVTISLRVIAKADAVISGGSTICANVEASLTVNLTGTAPFSFAYTDGTTTQTVTGINNKTYTLKVKPTTTTTYTITSVSDANGKDNPVTAGTDKTTVTVLPAPVATIQPLNACLGATATLTANTGTGYVYTWSNGGTGLTTTVNASGNYTVTVTDGNSCSTTSAPVNVKLNTIPTAKLNKPANTLICEGFSKPLTASGGVTYNWYRNGTLVKDSTKFTYYPSAEGSYTVDAVSAEGCTTKASDVVVLQFAKKPKANFTYDTYCRDVEMNFVNSSDEGGGEILYKWVFDANNASTEKEPVFTYNTAGAKTITLTATSKVCPDLTDIKTVNVTIEEPAPSQRYEAINGITGRSVNLKAQSKGDTYLWASKDGMNTGLSSASVEQPTLRVTKGDEYTVKISTKAGCVTVDTQLIRIFSGAQIFVPKAFTPNNDGVNDRLYPIPVGIPQITYFRVFNRWGVLLYETKQAGTPNNGVGWDGTYKGKPQPFDTYTWVAEGIDLDGKPVKLSGNSILLR